MLRCELPLFCYQYIMFSLNIFFYKKYMKIQWCSCSLVLFSAFLGIISINLAAVEIQWDQKYLNILVILDF